MQPRRYATPRLLLLVLALLLPLLEGPAHASSTQAAPLSPGCSPATSPVVIELTTLLPRAPRSPDEPLQLAGLLRSCSTEIQSGLQLRLTRSQRITTRSGLEDADRSGVDLGRVIEPAFLTAPTELRPGETQPFDLRLSVGALGMRDLGVYPITLRVRARSGEDRLRTPAGAITTFIPWFPTPPVRTRIAWLWPLVDEPHRTPSDLFLDDRLALAIDPGDGSPRRRGRLQELLLAAREGARGSCERPAAPAPGRPRPPPPRCAPAPVPITYAVDPDLLRDLETMSAPEGYALLARGGREIRPTSTAARSWLQTLRELTAPASTAPAPTAPAAPATPAAPSATSATALPGPPPATPRTSGAPVTPAPAAPGDVLALPFGDPDLALLASRSGLRELPRELYLLGQSETRRILYPNPARRRPLAELLWTPRPLTDLQLRELGAPDSTSLVLDPTALLSPPPSSRTPSTRVSLPRPSPLQSALVVEPGLAALLTPDTTSWDGPRLAEQRFIAETAIIAAEAPNLSRTLLVAPPRRGSVVPSLGAGAIAASARLPWLCPVRLSDVSVGREACPRLQGAPADTPPASPPLLDRSQTSLPGVLSSAELARLQAVRADATQFTDRLLLPDAPQARSSRMRLLRAEARTISSAAAAPRSRERLLALLEEDVATIRGGVRLVSSPVLLTGRSGVMQLTVQNELDQPVRVGVRLDETSSVRLSSEDTGLQVLPPRSATQVQVRVEPKTSGRFQVLATLLDADGAPYRDPVPLEVRSTYYGSFALGLTGLAALVLFAAAGRRIFRRVRTHRRRVRTP